MDAEVHEVASTDRKCRTRQTLIPILITAVVPLLLLVTLFTMSEPLVVFDADGRNPHAYYPIYARTGVYACMQSALVLLDTLALALGLVAIVNGIRGRLFQPMILGDVLLIAGSIGLCEVVFAGLIWRDPLMSLSNVLVGHGNLGLVGVATCGLGFWWCARYQLEHEWLL